MTTSCWLQAVSELLSQHVLQHYDKFVAGINEVARVEEDLVAAYQTVKACSLTLCLKSPNAAVLSSLVTMFAAHIRSTTWRGQSLWASEVNFRV